MTHLFLKSILLFFFITSTSSFDDGSFYDASAYIECQAQPELPLYGGGILAGKTVEPDGAFLLPDLIPTEYYCFSVWIKISNGTGPALIRASLKAESGEELSSCIGTVIAQPGCWSFLKGGFFLTLESSLSRLYIQSAKSKNLSVEMASPSLQHFGHDQWWWSRDHIIDAERKRSVMIHIEDKNGKELPGAVVAVEQVSTEFPVGSVVSPRILDSLPYQKWFTERFNVAVFENELQWLNTEPVQGQVNYSLPDQMLQFLRANGIAVRGHSVMSAMKEENPTWVRNLEGTPLRDAVNSRIQSLMSKYQGEFINWDVNDQEMHDDFFRTNLHTDATMEFFKTVHQADPLARLFMNERGVLESCTDDSVTVDAMISRMKELRKGGTSMEGIGLQTKFEVSFFDVANLPLMRAVLDKLAVLGLPIWLTGVDLPDHDIETNYKLFLVLREAFSHPAVDGIVISYPFVTFKNGSFDTAPGELQLVAQLRDWKTGSIGPVEVDGHGTISFTGFLGEYTVSVGYGTVTTTNYSFSLSRGQETEHWRIKLQVAAD